MIEDIINFVAIRPGLLTSGQPEPDQFADIQKAGVHTVINLVPPDSTDYLSEEPEIAADLGLEYIHIPVVWQAPTRQDLTLYFDALDSRRGSTVLAHCVVNYRVSAFTFLYRVLREGSPVESARQLMHSIWEPNPVWREFIEEQLAHPV